MGYTLNLRNMDKQLITAVKRDALILNCTLREWITEAIRRRLGPAICDGIETITIVATPEVRLTRTPPIIERAVEHASTRHDPKTCRIYGCLVCKELKA